MQEKVSWYVHDHRFIHVSPLVETLSFLRRRGHVGTSDYTMYRTWELRLTMISPRCTDGGDVAPLTSSTTCIFSATLLVNTARIIVKNDGRGLKLKEDGIWKGRVPSPPCCSVLPSWERAGITISSSSALFDPVRCKYALLWAMVLGDYKVVLPEVSGLVGMVGQCNLRDGMSMSTSRKIIIM